VKSSYKILLALAVVALVGVGYYGLAPLWRTTTLSEDTPQGAITVVSGRTITDTPAHPASGSVSILKASEALTLRYDSFKTINGPDLRVYLATDLDATEFVDLGELKATEGNVNYSIPTGTDISRYRYALVWCEDFGVLFNSADIAP
jgi:hypothetical protein